MFKILGHLPYSSETPGEMKKKQKNIYLDIPLILRYENRSCLRILQYNMVLLYEL